MAGQQERIVEACRQIRRFGGVAHTRFTYHFEIGAFDEQGRFDDAWSALRQWEKAVRGHCIKVPHHKWTPQELFLLISDYSPFAFLTGRLSLSARLMETALEMGSAKAGWSFEQIWHIYKTEPPRRRATVTLSHIYAALGRDLRSWERWAAFVEDVHPKILRLAGLKRAELLADPSRMDNLYRAIVVEREKRLTSGTSSGLRDLTKSAAEVRRAENPRMVVLQQSIEELFPELQDVPKPPTMREILDARS